LSGHKRSGAEFLRNFGCAIPARVVERRLKFAAQVAMHTSRCRATRRADAVLGLPFGERSCKILWDNCTRLYNIDAPVRV
jgi:hypothetical protein